MDGREASLALLQGFVRNVGDAWTTTLARVRAVLEGDDLTDSLGAIGRLGQTTAELHLALARGSGDFSSEPITHNDLAAWRAGIHSEVEAAADALANRDIRVDTARLLRRADGIEHLRGALKTRHHGDYHLGQVLEREEDGSFIIIDFEGEPARPLDVAGMLRSFDYARHAALRSLGSGRVDYARSADDWYAAVRSAFLDEYLTTVRRVANLVPEEVAAPLSALELEKAAYEVLYELNNRPDWLPIPLAALTAS